MCIRDRNREQPRLALGLEGGHSRRRILHVGDYTGHAVEEVLVERVRQDPRITVHEYHAAVDLLTRRRLGKTAGRSGDACGGAYVCLLYTSRCV